MKLNKPISTEIDLQWQTPSILRPDLSSNRLAILATQQPLPIDLYHFETSDTGFPGSTGANWDRPTLIALLVKKSTCSCTNLAVAG